MDKDTIKGMVERIEKFNDAKNNPTVSMNKEGHKANPDFVNPGLVESKRFEQLDKEEDQCTIKYGHDTPNGRDGCGHVSVSVDDDVDPDTEGKMDA